MNELLKKEIEDVKVELEELEECGDLEDKMEAILRLQELESVLNSHTNDEAKFHECTFCNGSGKQNDYGEIWDCGACNGRGASWS